MLVWTVLAMLDQKIKKIERKFTRGDGEPVMMESGIKESVKKEMDIT